MTYMTKGRRKSDTVLNDGYCARGLIATCPTIGTKLARLNADGFDEAFERLEFERFELELIADGLAHGLAALSFGIAVLLQMVYGLVAFEFGHGAAGYEIHIARGAGEIEILTAVHYGRACRAHVDSLCAVGI